MMMKTLTCIAYYECVVDSPRKIKWLVHELMEGEEAKRGQNNSRSNVCSYVCEV